MAKLTQTPATTETPADKKSIRIWSHVRANTNKGLDVVDSTFDAALKGVSIINDALEIAQINVRNSLIESIIEGGKETFKLIEKAGMDDVTTEICKEALRENMQKQIKRMMK